MSTPVLLVWLSSSEMDGGANRLALCTIRRRKRHLLFRITRAGFVTCFMFYFGYFIVSSEKEAKTSVVGIKLMRRDDDY